MTKPSPESSHSLRLASIADRSFVDSLALKFCRQVGFLPKEALDQYIERKEVTLALENGEASGFILAKRALATNPLVRAITQAAICYDAQRRQAGTALVAATAEAAIAAGQLALQCSCREGLEANDFWKACGFEQITRLYSTARRTKVRLLWRLQLTNVRPDWFEFPPERSGSRASRTIPLWKPMHGVTSTSRGCVAPPPEDTKP